MNKKIDKRKIRSNVKEEHQDAAVFRSPSYVYTKIIKAFPEYFWYIFENNYSGLLMLSWLI
jgi:hypothetical protein